MVKKRILFTLILLLVLCFVFAACQKEDTTSTEQPEVFVEFDPDTSVLSWSCKNASGYSLAILRSDGTSFFTTESIIQRNFFTLTNLKSDIYTATVTAYVKDKTYSTSITFAIGDGIIPPTGVTDGNEQLPQTYSKVVNRLLPVYYYRKGDDSLVLPLTEDDGVVKVEALGLLPSGMYSYNEKDNTLVLDKSYFDRFSTGFRTQIKWFYADGKTDSTYVQICNDYPLRVEGLEDDTFTYDTTSADLKYLSREIVLFFNDKPAELSSLSLKKICVDGKELSQIYYTVYQSSSKIKFSYSFFNRYTGVHLVEIYTSWGKTVFYINVVMLATGRDKYPYDLKIDCDSDYPEIKVKWSINDTPSNYIVKINGKNYYSFTNPELFDGCSFDATGKLNYGDTVSVVAEYDGKGYQSTSSCTFDINISDETVASYLSYDKSFDFMGNKNNFYISDEDELRDLVYYMLIYYDSLDKTDILKADTATYDNEVRVYLYPGFVATQAGLDSKIDSLALQLNEAIKGSFVVFRGENNGEYVICGDIDSTCVPDEEIRTSDIRKNISDVHYSSVGRGSDYEGFAINSADTKATVYYSEELYIAVERGVCPVPVEGTSAYEIYERAKSVLRQIIDDGMTDYEKIHAISDWLAANVIYDYQLEKDLASVSSTSPEYDKFYSCRSLYLEGAFIDGVAVCNGYAKAMSLLCGIEGIPCYKIKGKSGSGQHAWNKVCAGGAWYVVDPTWAVKRYPNSNSGYEVLRHQYLFMSESTSGNLNGGKHYEQYTGLYTGYYAGEDYNVYANTFFEYGGKLNDYVIDNADELKLLAEYYAQKYADVMISGRYLLIDVGGSITNLTKYVSALNSGTANAYSYAVETYDGINATLKMTKK